MIRAAPIAAAAASDGSFAVYEDPENKPATRGAGWRVAQAARAVGGARGGAASSVARRCSGSGRDDDVPPPPPEHTIHTQGALDAVLAMFGDEDDEPATPPPAAAAPAPAPAPAAAPMPTPSSVSVRKSKGKAPKTSGFAIFEDPPAEESPPPPPPPPPAPEPRPPAGGGHAVHNLRGHGDGFAGRGGGEGGHLQGVCGRRGAAADPHDVTCRSLLRGFMSEAPAPAPARRRRRRRRRGARAVGRSGERQLPVRAAVGGGGAVNPREAGREAAARDGVAPALRVRAGWEEHPADAAPPPTLAAGSALVLGRRTWRVLGTLGDGANASVYRVREEGGSGGAGGDGRCMAAKLAGGAAGVWEYHVHSQLQARMLPADLRHVVGTVELHTYGDCTEPPPPPPLRGAASPIAPPSSSSSSSVVVQELAEGVTLQSLVNLYRKRGEHLDEMLWCAATHRHFPHLSHHALAPAAAAPDPPLLSAASSTRSSCSARSIRSTPPECSTPTSSPTTSSPASSTAGERT